MIRAVFTCGDVNGIGPEISLKVFNKIISSKNKNKIIFICPKNIFEFYYKQLKLKFHFQFINAPKEASNLYLNVLPLQNIDLKPGKITAKAGKTSYDAIITALKLIKDNDADILITAPISKEAINKSGIVFSGHTELLASSENTDDYLMMFLSNNIKSALLTIHKPLNIVSSLISKEKIISAVKLLHKTAIQDFGIPNPSIAVLGLNPHAGENGLIGDEEINVISPSIKYLRKKYLVDGPFVPDAFWGNKTYKKYDIILGMYHDQLLIPFKLLHFNSGVNFTAGLKLIRTSPDHGTAFNIAGENIADASSLFESYKYAIKIFNNRNKYFASTIKH